MFANVESANSSNVNGSRGELTYPVRDETTLGEVSLD